MKKSILKNVAVIALAVFGFMIIGNNAIYGIHGPIKEGGDMTCSGGYCSATMDHYSCEACCAEGQTPRCNSVGCTCIN